MSAERLRGLVERWRSVDYRVEASTDDALSVLRTCGDELEQAIGEMADEAAVERAALEYDLQVCGADTWAMLSKEERDMKRKWMKAALLAAPGGKP